MNQILKLSGRFLHGTKSPMKGAAQIPINGILNISKIEKLIDDLEAVIDFWENHKSGFPPLVAVQYISVIAKSNRVSKLFSSSGKSPNSCIVGAKFSSELNPRHIITYCVPLKALKVSLETLEDTMEIITRQFEGMIDYEALMKVSKGETRLQKTDTSKSAFAEIIKDCFYSEGFSIPEPENNATMKEAQIVSLFDTGLSFEATVEKAGLRNEHFSRASDTTWLLNPRQYAILYSNAPFLISMSLNDWSQVAPFESSQILKTEKLTVPKPHNEPVIGVIDTLFCTDVYFSDWVDYRCMVENDLIEEQDFCHGTAVSSLIVDGPQLNPYLDDGCGHFRVRHFGIAKTGRTSIMKVIKDIRMIVSSNPDIKVWNLSLGSEIETSINCISPVAAVLDELQFEHDAIFVVAGTNNNDKKIKFPRVGSPADSLNSVVVNSISFSGKPEKYSRSGPVLCFFNKPDVSAFGGNDEDGMTVYSSNGRQKKSGTSYAAPWIARKLAYLIQVMNLPREVAKALIIDSAAGWNTDGTLQNLIGFGKVPTRISDILNTPSNEIKFFVQGVSETYDTYAYNIPVPKWKDKYPFVAKATLCYFPKSARKQGVDYTCTEMDVHFGRLHNNKIKSIDNNQQGDPGFIKLYEADARKNYRKWDNVKHITEGIVDNAKPRKAYPESSFWGISVKAKERLEEKSGKGVHFGIVITLSEVNNKNRIDEFIKLCEANSWFVSKVDIQAMVQNYQEAQATIKFDD